MAMDPQILGLLRDPETHDSLELGDNCLMNPKSGRLRTNSEFFGLDLSWGMLCADAVTARSRRWFVSPSQERRS